MERKKVKRQGGTAAATTAQGLDQSKAKINNKGDQPAGKQKAAKNNTSYVDYLINCGKEYENKRKQEKDQKEILEFEGLTFQPNMDR